MKRFTPQVAGNGSARVPTFGSFRDRFNSSSVSFAFLTWPFEIADFFRAATDPGLGRLQRMLRLGFVSARAPLRRDNACLSWAS